MRQKLLTMIAVMGVGFGVSIFAADKEKGDKPEGKIDIKPDQKCSGTQTVAIGNKLTLKAVSLKDKDLYCGNPISDSINTTTGVKWVVGGGMGSLAGGDTGNSKDWTAPDDTHTSVAVRLQVDDEATGTNTTDDGGFVEVSNINVDVVAPNDASWTTTTHAPTCTVAGETAQSLHLVDTVKRSGCTVDFKDLNWTEDSTPKSVTTGCGFGPGVFGPVFMLHIGASNTVDNGFDNVGFDCNSLSFPTGCSSGWSLDWKASRSAAYGTGSWYTVITRNYQFLNSTGAATNSLGLGISASK